MTHKWYVIHTYSGYENKVKAALEEWISAYNKKDFFSEILIPSEKVVGLVKGKKKMEERRFFPGYVLIKMELNDETWHIVRKIPKVTGFIGQRTKPIPIPDSEVEEIVNQIREGTLKPKPKETYEKGDAIRIIDGPFTNFNAVVEEIKPEKGKLRALVSIFGRPTPVELEFLQVKKA